MRQFPIGYKSLNNCKGHRMTTHYNRNKNRNLHLVSKIPLRFQVLLSVDCNANVAYFWIYTDFSVDASKNWWSVHIWNWIPTSGFYWECWKHQTWTVEPTTFPSHMLNLTKIGNESRTTSLNNALIKTENRNLHLTKILFPFPVLSI